MTDVIRTYINTGIQSRMNRIFLPKDGKTLMLAIDHPYFQGPTTGLKRMTETISTLMPYADCLMTTRGAVRNNIPIELLGSKPIMLRVSGGNSVINEDLSDEKITVTIKEAIRMGADGIAVSAYIGSPNQQQTIINLASMINEAEEYGIPTLAVTAVGKNMARDLRYLAFASRICQDIGARIVKTYYCDGFEKLVEWLDPTPVVVAGGKKTDTDKAIELAYNAIQAGAKGLDMGRNFFQNENPVGMMKAIRGIVHDDFTVKEALQVYNETKSKKLE
ncbi:MAG: 3-hydroxy-5-phosphonooxypentane-2,4-dione thiolase [Promethearchaeota archaeon]